MATAGSRAGDGPQFFIVVGHGGQELSPLYIRALEHRRR